MAKKNKPDLTLVGKKELTYKMKKFASNCAQIPKKFSGIKQAYCDAYDVTMKDGKIPKWVSKDSSLLHCDPRVTLLVKSLLEKKEDISQASSLRTRAYVIEQLYEESKTGSDASRVRSLELLGRSVSMFSDVIETKELQSSDEIRSEIERRLSALVAENE